MKNYFLYPSSEAALPFGFEVSSYKVKNISVVAPHTHDFYELYFLLSDDVQFSVGGETFDIAAKTALLVPPQTEHRAAFKTQTEVYDRFVLWIRRDLAIGSEESICHIPLGSPISLSEDGAKDLIQILILLQGEQTRLELQLSPPRAELVFAEKLTAAALALLARECASKKFSDLVSRAIAEISANLDKPLSLADLSDKLFVSRFYLSHRFKSEVGVSVFDYISDMRLALAQKLLLQNAPAREVAESCGYTDYSNFYKAFKQKFGVSPKQYAEK